MVPAIALRITIYSNNNILSRRMFPFELLLLQYHERTYGSLTFRQWEQYSASGSPEAAELTPSCPAVESQLRERGDVMWPWPSTNKTRMDERSRRKMMEHRRGGTAWRTPTCTTTDVMMRRGTDRGTDRCGWMNQNEWKNELMNYRSWWEWAFTLWLVNDWLLPPWSCLYYIVLDLRSRLQRQLPNFPMTTLDDPSHRKEPFQQSFSAVFFSCFSCTR